AYVADMADYTFPGEWIKDNMVLEPRVTGETINQLESFEMTEDDVLIASYPKTGTTWAQELIWLLNTNAELKKALSVPVYERIRMNRALGNFQGSWDDFFELYKTKHLLYGDYFEWYANWLEYKEKSNIKLLKYEDMHHKMSDVIDDLLQFLDGVENGKKIAECITFIGKKTYGVLRDLCSPVAPSTKTFKELCDLLTTHYKAKRLEMGESYHVKETNQELSESIANYSTLLRDAATCNIGEYLDWQCRQFLHQQPVEPLPPVEAVPPVKPIPPVEPVPLVDERRDLDLMLVT
ncbi:hypothetical protein LSH36_1493g00000, partial [Paralvinella palmiformis]